MWQLRQLTKIAEIEPEAVAAVWEALRHSDRSLYEKMVLGAYLDGEISLAKAAELLQEHPVHLRLQWLARGIPIRLGAESPEELSADAVAARAMRQSTVTA